MLFSNSNRSYFFAVTHLLIDIIILLKPEKSSCIPQDPASQRLIFIHIYFLEKGKGLSQIYRALYVVVFNQ